MKEDNNDILADLSLAISECGDESEILTLMDEFALPDNTESLVLILSTAYSNYKNMSRKNPIYIGWFSIAKRAYEEVLSRQDFGNYQTIVSSCEELQNTDIDSLIRHYKTKMCLKIIFGLAATIIILAIAGYSLFQACSILESI